MTPQQKTDAHWWFSSRSQSLTRDYGLAALERIEELERERDEALAVAECCGTLRELAAEVLARGQRIVELEREAVDVAECIEAMKQGYLERLADLEQRNATLVAACRPVIREAEQRDDFRADNWNQQAHVELTLTIAEIRAIEAAAKGGA